MGVITRVVRVVGLEKEFLSLGVGVRVADATTGTVAFDCVTVGDAEFSGWVGLALQPVNPSKLMLPKINRK